MKTFSLRSERKQGCPLLLLLLNRVFPVPVGSVTQEKEIKSNKIGKKEVKLSLLFRVPVGSVTQEKEIKGNKIGKK